MNELTQISTALSLPESHNLAALFKSDSGVSAFISKLVAAARAEAATLSADTKKGRGAIISLAYKVSKSKAEFDRQGKALTERQRLEIEAVNAGRKTAAECLDALRDEIRKPVDDWEAAKEAETQRIKDRLSVFDAGRADAQCTVEQITAVIASIEAQEIGADWGAHQPVAEIASSNALSSLRANLLIAQLREDQEAELTRLRAESAERDEADRKAQVERDRVAAIEAAAVEAVRVAKEEVERAAQAEQDKNEAVGRARADAEELAAREKVENEARHTRELEDAKVREEAAAQAERDRAAAERKSAADARVKREADKAHVSKIKHDIADALAAMAGAASPEQIADALMSGQIPHCEVKL